MKDEGWALSAQSACPRAEHGNESQESGNESPHSKSDYRSIAPSSGVTWRAMMWLACSSIM